MYPKVFLNSFLELSLVVKNNKYIIFPFEAPNTAKPSIHEVVPVNMDTLTNILAFVTLPYPWMGQQLPKWLKPEQEELAAWVTWAADELSPARCCLKTLS